MTHRLPQFACIYIRDFPIQAMLRLRPSFRQEPCVVMEGDAPLQRVCSTNSEAHKVGAVVGMTPAEVETLPNVHTLLRSVEEEDTAKAALLQCAWTFSPRVEAHTSHNDYFFVIDITGTETLNGYLITQASRLLNNIQTLGLAGSIAISTNYHTALCVARSLDADFRKVIIPPGMEKEALSELQLHVLSLEAEQAYKFQTWGIHTLGLLAKLPESELISRLGQEGKRLLQLANGTLHHFFRPVEHSEKMAEFLELDTPVVLLDSLLFVIVAMLEQLVFRAAERILSLASTHIVLTMEGSLSHERTVASALPTNDRKIWTKLIHLDLEAHPPSAPILAIRISAETGIVSTVQMGLFSPQTPEANRLEVAIARIKSIVGEGSVGSAVLGNTQKPDLFTIVPFRLHPDSKGPPPLCTNRLSMRRMRPPECVLVTSGDNRISSVCFRQTWYEVHRCYGPWVTNGEWWHTGHWNQEQWDILARSNDGQLLACCLVHTPADYTWHLVSLYD